MQYTLVKPDNLVKLFETSVAQHSDRNWLGTKDKATNTYKWVTYRDTALRVDNLRSGLAQLDINRGSTVGIIANNSVEWAVACYATYGRAARFVPMYLAEMPKVWRYIVEDSDTKVLLVYGQEVYDAVSGWVDDPECPSLTDVIRIDGSGPGSMAELEKLGAENPTEAVYPEADEIAGLIYTSGTTGEPKGVLLSHGNITSNVHAAHKSYPFLDTSTKTLSFLPWAHSYGQTAELHTIMKLGGSTGFAESPLTIVDDLLLVQPTMLVSVPRIFNKVYSGIWAKMEAKGGLAQKLFLMGINAGKQRRELNKRGQSSLLNSLKLKLADRVVFSQIRKKFGGKMRMSLSSSAALSPRIAEFFDDVGIPVYEAWGMTELSPAASVNTPLERKVGSAGKPLDMVRLRIDKSVTSEDSRDGELIVYGPNVMKGYHKKPEATKEVTTEDGGLRTGDRAYIDDDGFLFITGRIKEQFKLENGKFVFPAQMEEEIKLLRPVEQAMVLGLNQPFTVCLIFPDGVVLEQYARENGLSGDLAQLVKNPEVNRYYQDLISDHLSGKFGRYEIPRKVLLLDEGFSMDNGMLTPTFKVKRRHVFSKYQSQIDAMYQDQDPASHFGKGSPAVGDNPTP